MTQSISTLLIANRGEIAARIIRTAHALGIATVAVYSDPDAEAPYVTLADQAVRLPGAAPADTYLRGDLIIAAAAATSADAVHPGYGFLSENAAFARACADAGLIFVGPSPGTIQAMSDKIAAKATMAAAGVPVLPGVTVEDDGEHDAAAQVGFPLLVKAAFGGGGRGMRLVSDPAQLAGAVGAARREAAAAFGDGTVFLERYVPDPRHVEVQILGDAHGDVVHLFERECSIQRRYQKIVEESPSPAVDGELRAALTKAAVTAGRAAGYTGAGTVEFVLDRDGSFYFLEMNTRLQVEHPVTEAVTGLDLVELQLRVAEGEPLPPEVREAAITGHAIEVRLYAEDVPAGFLPVTGTLHRFAIPSGPGLRVDTGFRDGSAVSPHYDAMLAKVIAHGRSRADAARRLARALRDAQIHGLTTNRDLLVAILREPEFLAGATDTGYLTRHQPAALAGSGAGSGAAPGPATARHALVAALARQVVNRAAAPVLGTLPSGWRNVVSRAAAGQLHRRGGAVRRGLPRPRRHRPGLRQRRAAGPGHDHRKGQPGPRRPGNRRDTTGVPGAPGRPRHVRRRQRRVQRPDRGAAVRRPGEARARRVAARPHARAGPARAGRGRRGRDGGSAAARAGGDEDGADRGRPRRRRRGRTPGQSRPAGRRRPGPGRGRDQRRGRDSAVVTQRRGRHQRRGRDKHSRSRRLTPCPWTWPRSPRT